MIPAKAKTLEDGDKALDILNLAVAEAYGQQYKPYVRTLTDVLDEARAVLLAVRDADFTGPYPMPADLRSRVLRLTEK